MIVYCFAWNFGWIFICLLTPIVISWWSQGESWHLVTVLHDEVKWSETLWVTLIELWLRQCSWRILTSSLNGTNGDLCASAGSSNYMLGHLYKGLYTQNRVTVQFEFWQRKWQLSSHLVVFPQNSILSAIIQDPFNGQNLAILHQ
jgi:hypothetical protein